MPQLPRGGWEMEPLDLQQHKTTIYITAGFVAGFIVLLTRLSKRQRCLRRHAVKYVALCSIFLSQVSLIYSVCTATNFILLNQSTAHYFTIVTVSFYVQQIYDNQYISCQRWLGVEYICSVTLLKYSFEVLFIPFCATLYSTRFRGKYSLHSNTPGIGTQRQLSALWLPCWCTSRGRDSSLTVRNPNHNIIASFTIRCSCNCNTCQPPNRYPTRLFFKIGSACSPLVCVAFSG